jgi:transposase
MAWVKIAGVFLKTHCVRKDGKEHRYYSLCESLRVSRKRVLQRQVLHLGELNSTQVERWQRTIEVIKEDGRRHQMRLFAKRDGEAMASAAPEDVAEVQLSSLVVRHPRSFGACWIGCKLFEQLGLREFWQQALGEQAGAVPWAKVVELLVVNRLVAPRSELFIHEKWFGQTAMGVLLDAEATVADKDRLYRALDRMVEHKPALEKHLASRWKDLFGASFDVLLYDLTSTYFEGDAAEVEKAQRGYSRDHRPDCKQVIIALVVTPEGFPLSYEVFDGNRPDVTTLDEMLDVVEARHGRARRVWVFDRGIVSEENLERLRRRGASYLVGTPRSALKIYERRLLEGDWQNVSTEVEVQLVAEDQETYVLARSHARAQKERAMRLRVIRGLMRDLIRLRRSIRDGRIKDTDKLLMRLGSLSERYPQAWRYVKIRHEELPLRWQWDRQALARAASRDGAYLLRTNLQANDPVALWRQYVQLTEVEAVFRALKSDLAIRPIWHFTPRRVEAHILVAFLGYCLWVCLKAKLRTSAPSLTPWQVLDQFGRILMVEVWFKLREGGCICLERITQPEPAQAALIDQLGWPLPQQPPPRIYTTQLENVWTT